MMKNFAKIFTAIVVAFAAYSCVADATEDLGVNINVVGQNSLTLSLDETRVQLGEKADGVYPLYWSNGDQIAVNGVASTPLTDVAEDAKSATFKFDGNGVSTPFNIVYPAPGVEAEEGATVFPVVFPASQAYVAGNIDPKAMVMYGYAESGEVVTLNPLVGVLQINVKGAVTLTSLTVKSHAAGISGTYDVNCKTGALTAHEGASQIVNVTFPEEGLELNAETATPIYVAVPAGSYGVFLVTLHTESDKMTVKFNSDVKPIAAGTVREFKSFSYAANTADEDTETYEIDSKEALIEFAEIAASFYPRTKAVVTATIDMSGEDWTPIEGFGAYEFDGGEFEISGLNAPLFGSTAATIKNVKLTNVNIVENGTYTYGEQSYVLSGAVAYRLVGGKLDNCYTSGNIEVSNTTFDKEKANGYYLDVCLGGVVGYVNNSEVSNCENHINLTINSTWKETTTSTLQVGAGAMFGVADNGTSFNKCANHGALTVNAAFKKNGNITLGGVLGTTSYHEDVKSITYCDNYGAITVSDTFTSQGDYYVGGVAGCIHTGCDNISNLTNLGTIHISGKSIAGAEAFVAGVLGDAYDSADNLVNGSETDASKGAIIVDFASAEGYPNDKTYIAGVLVRSGAELTNCKNYGKISATTSTAGNTYLAGVLGSVYSANPSKVENCYNYGDIYYGGTKSNALYIGGLISQSWNSTATESTTTISNSENAGNIEVSIATDATISGKKYVGGIFGYHSASSGNGSAKSFSYDNVEYSGNLYYASLGTTSECYVGGMLGTMGSYVNCEFSECESSGNVYIGYTRNATTGQPTELANALVGGATKISLFMAGWGGAYNKLTDCTVSGDLKINSQFTTTDQVHVAGFGGYGGSPMDAEGCTFSGLIEFNQNSSTAKALHLGGFFGYYNDSSTVVTQNTIKECTVSSDAKIIMAGTVNNELRMGGIIAWMKKSARPMYLYGCSNYGTLELAPTAKTTSTTAIGGLIGKPEAKTVNFVGCWNEGNFNISGNSLAGTYVGGLVGNNYSGVITASTSTEYPYFYNRGNITIGNTNEGDAQMTITSHLCIGGFVGYNQKAYTINASFSNVGKMTTQNVLLKNNFYIGGCLGYSSQVDTFGDGVEFVNIGDIEVGKNTTTTAGKTIGIGGVVSSAKKAFTNCKSYCNIIAIGLEGKVGHIMGTAYAETTKATNCGVGGKIAFAETETKEDDPNGGDPITTTTPTYTTIDASNWFNYIYSDAVTKDVATGDGCSLLPTVPTITYAPTPAAN